MLESKIEHGEQSVGKYFLLAKHHFAIFIVASIWWILSISGQNYVEIRGGVLLNVYILGLENGNFPKF